MIVNGYAYPTIGEEVLDWWINRISWISTFSYGFNEKGDLIDLEDERLIEKANGYGVRPMMVLTSMDESGSFNASSAISVFNDLHARENLINNIEKNIRSKGMGGVDFDIEYLPGDYADDYVDLVAQTQERLSKQGYLTTVALAPKTSAAQKGVLYEGHDYAGMGEVADYCLIMTYEWGYTYGEPMAVSPIGNVRKVLEYAISEIPSRKILMGMNNYGYDWTLPYVKGESKAQKITNYEAEARAEYYNVPVQFDETAQAPFFNYYDQYGRGHIVWFENAKSWSKRLELVDEFDLAGIGIWTIMSIFYGGI